MSNTNLAIVSEIWNAIRESIPEHERSAITETVVGILMEHDFALADIRYEFGSDPDMVETVNIFSETEDEWADESDEAEYVDDEDEEWD